MDTFVYMYTYAVVWLNYIGASRKMENGHGLRLRSCITSTSNALRQLSSVFERKGGKPDGRYVDHMRTL